MYKSIIDVLDTFLKANWFLDSGSLLGIVRDGVFLKSDRGIDISCICDDVEISMISKCVNELSKLGFIVSEYQWEGKTYKYCFVPQKKNPCFYAFDLHLFRDSQKGNYVCPQVSLNKENNRIKGYLRSLKKGNPLLYSKGPLGIIKYIFGYAYRYFFHYFGGKVDMSKYAKNGAQTFFWLLPKSMYHGTEKGYENFNLLRFPEPYLQFRYGNWRIPVEDWVTVRDDGGLEQCSYEDITHFMTK